jgi:hypothetical protein
MRGAAQREPAEDDTDDVNRQPEHNTQKLTGAQGHWMLGGIDRKTSDQSTSVSPDRCARHPISFGNGLLRDNPWAKIPPLIGSTDAAKDVIARGHFDHINNRNLVLAGDSDANRRRKVLQRIQVLDLPMLLWGFLPGGSGRGGIGRSRVVWT